MAKVIELLVSYGWALLALVSLIVALFARLKPQRRTRRQFTAVVLLILACGWFIAVDEFGIVWRDYSKTTSPDGSATAWVHLSGFTPGKYVCVRRNGQEWKFRLGDFEQPRPERIFWLSGGQSIGVEYAAGARTLDGRPVANVVLDVFPVPKDPADRSSEEFSSEEYRHMYSNWALFGRPRPPTTEELKYFSK